MIGCGKGWTSRYINRRWSFGTLQDVKIFFATINLGHREIVDGLD